MKPQEYLGRVGVWALFDNYPASQVKDGAPWYGEAFGRDALTQAPMWLEDTEKMVVATGGCEHFHAPPDGHDRHRAHPRRGLRRKIPLRTRCHRTTDQPALMGVPFHGNAVQVMHDYLNTMDSIEPARRVLAALGPKMPALAGTPGHKPSGTQPHLRGT